MYQDEFMAAADRTKRFGLKCPDINVSDNRFLSEERLEQFPFMLRDTVGEIGLEELMAQCISIHYKLVDPVSDIFQIPAYYTIGYVDVSGNTLFEQDEKSLRKMLESGLPSLKLNIHAWLTLPSMEILDFSLPTSVAVIKKMKEGLGGLIAAHADEFRDGLKYHPMLIGADFFKKTGAIIDLWP